MCRSFEPPLPWKILYTDSKSPLFIFFPNLPPLIIFIWKYCLNETQHKQTKISQEKVIFSKQHYMSFMSDIFISNAVKIITISGIIRSLKKDKCNCIGPPTFQSQRYRVGYQSNQKLLHLYQHVKNELSS